MREPVLLGVLGDSLGLAVAGAGSVGREAPDVPATGAIGVDVNPLSVFGIIGGIATGIVGAVIEAGIGGEAFFLASGDSPDY